MSNTSDNKHGHPIELLPLSARSYNALLNAGISTIEYAIKMEYALTTIRGLGNKSIEEIRNGLVEWKESGIHFDASTESLNGAIIAELGSKNDFQEKETSLVIRVHPIQLLSITPRCVNALIRAGITTVEGALKFENLLGGIPGLGKTGAERVRQSMEAWEKTKFGYAEVQNSHDVDASISFSSFTDLFQQIVNRYTTGKRGGIPDSRRAEIIMARFTGHSSYNEKHTLEKVGRKFSITREWVRQICEQFMLYLDFFFEYYLRQRIDDFDHQLAKNGVFDFDTFRSVTSSVFPEFRDRDFLDFFHLLQSKNSIFEITNEIQANQKLLLFSACRETLLIYFLIFTKISIDIFVILL